MKIVKSKRERELLSETTEGRVTIKEKLSLAHCRKVLNRDGNNYSDEQILEIRDFLYKLATLDYLFFQDYLKKQNQENEKSISLHQGQHRRAS